MTTYGPWSNRVNACRLESLVEEVSAHAHDPTPRPSLPAPAIGGAQTGLLARPTAEMHKAPLIARVHMRMGIWRWTVTEVSASQ